MSSVSLDAAPTTSAATSDGDVLMTRAHKQLLSMHRDSLVENMYPDDVLNRLQARKVLTARDVTRIKEKGGIDSQNETLLDVLLRKPDRAFDEFIASLRETDQRHVAKLIVGDETPQGRDHGGGSSASSANSNVSTSNRQPPPHLQFSDEEGEDEEVGIGARRRTGRTRARFTSPGSATRRQGAVGVRLQASAVQQDDEVDADDEGSRGASTSRVRTPRSAGRSTPRNASALYQSREDDLTAQINDEILETSLIELQNLRDIAEGGVTTQSMSARKRILKTLGQLQKMRREILGVYDGSVIFMVACPTLDSLDDLWMLCEGGKLAAMFQDAFVTRDLKRRFRVKTVTLSVSMKYSDYVECKKELEGEESRKSSEKKDVKRSSSLKENDQVLNIVCPQKTPDSSGSSPFISRHPLNEFIRHFSPAELLSGNSRSSSGVSSSSLTSEEYEEVVGEEWEEETENEDSLYEGWEEEDCPEG